MRKIILLFSAIVLLQFVSFSQESSSNRLIHIAYSPSTSAAIGLHAGWIANNGGVLSGGDILGAIGPYVAVRYNDRDILHYDRLSAVLGGTVQLFDFLHVYAGAGYGDYKYPYKEPTLLPDEEISGVEVAGGVIVKIGAFTVHAGISDLDFQKLDLVGGVGYTF